MECHKHVHLHANVHVLVHVRVRVLVFVLLCGAMSRRVSRLVVSCRLSFVMLCSVVLCCCVLLLVSLRAFLGYWSVCVHRVCRPCAVLLSGCLRDQVELNSFTR